MTASSNGRVVAAYDIGQGKVRCVIELADHRLTAIDTVADGRGPSPELFRAQPLPDFISFAARCFAGDPRAVSHPKAVLVLATAIVALVAALDPPSPEKDVPVDPR